MIQITREDLERYKKVQNIHRQTRYGYHRWKASGLSLEKYLYIADNEDKYFKNKR